VRSLNVEAQPGRCSAHLLGDCVQCMQDVYGEFACRVVAQLGVGADGVRDELETNLVGSAKRCERSHRISFVVEHVRSQPSCSILMTLRRFAANVSATSMRVLRLPILEGQDVRIQHSPVEDLDRPAHRLIGLPRVTPGKHRRQVGKQRLADLPGRRIRQVGRAVVDRIVGDVRADDERRPLKRGRARPAEPIASSQDTSTMRLFGRSAARSSPSSRNVSGALVSCNTQLTMMSCSARYPASGTLPSWVNAKLTGDPPAGFAS
jgi:hypothetical protein